MAINRSASTKAPKKGQVQPRPKSIHLEQTDNDDVFESTSKPSSSHHGPAQRPRAKSTAGPGVLGTSDPDGPSEGGGPHQESSEKKKSVSLIRRWSETSNNKAEGSSSSTTPCDNTQAGLANVISIGSSVKVLVDYRPVKDDEVGVVKGQQVQVNICVFDIFCPLSSKYI